MHERWNEFCRKLEGPDHLNFHERTPGDASTLTWSCYPGQDDPRRLSHARRLLTEMGLTSGEIADSFEFYEAHGAHCDCEILFNVDENFGPLRPKIPVSDPPSVLRRYEQKAWVTVRASSLAGAKQEIDRLCQLVEENEGIVSLEDGVPEMVDATDDET